MRGLVVDLADGGTERPVRLGAGFETARLQNRERRDRGGGESDADADHASIAVLDHECDPMRGARPRAQRCGRSGVADGGGAPKPASEKRKSDGETNEGPAHARTTPLGSMRR